MEGGGLFTVLYGTLGYLSLKNQSFIIKILTKQNLLSEKHTRYLAACSQIGS